MKEEEVVGGVIREGMSGSIDKNGVITVNETEESQEAHTEGKQDLLDYLESQPDVEDPFAEIVAEQEKKEPEKPQELTRAQHFAEFIRLRSGAAQLTAYQTLKAEDEEIDQIIEELREDESCQDVKTIKGNRDVYFYSVNRMSDNYAMIAMYVEEKDLVETIAQMVRFNCKTYPAPTPLTYFENHPYFYTQAQIERAVSLLVEKETYRDVHPLTNSEGTKYLYSDLTMSEVYAKALIEPDEFTA
ncbi:MAG: hypothetical protein Q4F28_07235 [Eubacteriales bacterium]|nr:hypothetical protein [Eubacteriales bacterium]